MTDDRLPSVSAEDAIQEVQSGIYLLDVREIDEWTEVHAEGAHHIPMGQLGERQQELPEDERILVICHSGGRSARVTRALRDAGYDAVNVDGGTSAYRAAGGPVAAGE